MTARLRELAERWKGDGCRNGSSHECADELLSILDAEGDGDGVAQYQYRFQRPPDHNWSGWINCDKSLVPMLDGKPGHEVRGLYTHPARSGVVSDADVEAACRAYIASDRFLLDGAVESMREPMRAALTHFAEGTEVGGDAEDAARYRWLREHFRFANDSLREIWFDAYTRVSQDDAKDLDKAIDAAVQEQSHE